MGSLNALFKNPKNINKHGKIIAKMFLVSRKDLNKMTHNGHINCACHVLIFRNSESHLKKRTAHTLLGFVSTWESNV